MKIRTIIIIIIVWLSMWMVTWPALLADLNRHEHFPPNQQKEFRFDLGASMFFAFLPPTWIVAPFITGFYEHGFQFSRRPVEE